MFVADTIPPSSNPGRTMAALALLLSCVVFPSVGSAQESQLPLVSPVLTYSGTVHSGTTILTETGSVTVSATMDKAATDTVTVTISVAPANYNAPREFATEDDYVVSENKVLTFVPGSLASTGTVTITGVDDGGVKKHLRRIRINYTTSSNARTDRRGQPIAFEEFIIADDEPHPTKSMVLTPTTISENGGVATVTAKLSHPTLFGDVKLDVQTGLYPEGTPNRADSSDFMLSDNVRLVISKGDTLSTGTVTITAVDDDVVGSALKRMGARLHNIERGTVTTEPGLYSTWSILAIEEDDKPTVSLSVSPNPVDEGQSVTVTAELSAAIADDVTIPLVLTAGTAEPGDYGTLASITITGGGTTETGTITTADDADRDDETFTVALGTLPSAVTPGSPSSVDVTINDDDAQPPALVVEPMSLTVAEGGRKSGSYTVKLATEPSDTVTVSITGQSGTDLTLASSTPLLTFTTTTWNVAQTVTVLAGEDDDTSNDEETLVHTASGGGYDALTANVMVTVIDDDEVALVVDPTSLTVAEGGSGSYTVRLATQPSATVTVAIAGHAGTDLTLGATSLTFNPSGSGLWSAAQTVTVSAGHDDDTSNDAATLVHTASGGDYDSETANVAVTVTDDDPATRTVSLSVTPNPVAEGNSATVTARLSGTLPSGVTIPLTLTAGTAEPGDYGALASITITGGETTATGTITTIDDADADDETFTVALGTLPSAVTPGTPSSVEVTIKDHDAPALVVDPTSLTVAEGGSATYTVRLATQPSATVTVAITGQAGTDLTLGATSLTFNPSGSNLWSTAQTVTVSAGHDDDTSNDAATLVHTASGGDYAGETANVAVTVTDDDPATRIVSLSVTPNPVAEGNSATVTARLSGPLPNGVTIPLMLTPGTAEPGDYGALASITITGGETTATGRITTIDDADADDETFTVALGTLPSAVTPGTPSSVEVTIKDHDAPALVVDPTSLTVAEGGSATYTVRLATQPSATVTVAITGHAGTDLTLGATSLTFNPSGSSLWSTAQTVTVSAGEDDDTSNDAATLVHTASGGDYAGETANVAVTVTDDDDGTPETRTVSLSASPNPVNEGGPVTVTARLSRPLPSGVTIPLTLTAGTAESGDYGSLAGITVTGGDATGTGTVTTVEDADEDDETFTVALGVLPDGLAPGSPSSIEVTIRDRTLPPPPPNRPPTVTNHGPEFGQSEYLFELPENLDGRIRPIDLGTVEAEDPDGDELTYGIVFGDSERFTIGAQDGVVRYIGPGEDYETEPNRFELTVRVRDGFGADGAVRVVVVVTDVNELPEVTASCDPCSVPRDGEVRVEAKATDPDGDPLTYAWSAPRGGFSGADEPVARWTAPAELGTVAIRVEVSDGRGGSASAVVEVEVVNLAPAFGQPAYGFELPENLDGRDRPVDLGQVTAEDPDGDALTYEIASGDRERFAVGARDGVVRYVGPGEDFETAPNLYELTVRVRDGFGAEDAARVVVTVTDVNELPEVTAACDPCSVPRGTEVWLEAEATDPDGDPLAYAWSAEKGSFSGSPDAPRAVWTAPAELGMVAIRVEISDGRGGSASAVVEVEVVNRAPAFGQPFHGFRLSENVDGRERPADVGQVMASDPDGDALTYELASGDRERFAVGARDGVVRYVGRGEDFETEPNRFELVVRARDGFGGDARTEVAVEVTDVNEAPEAVDDEAVTPEDQAVTVDVLANDTDPEGDLLRVRSVTAAAHGAVRLVSGDRVTYTPEADFHGADSFTYVASDGRGLTDTASVEVTVLPVNDAPTAVGTIPDQTLDEGGGAVHVDLSPFFGDVDGDALTYGARSSDTGVVLTEVAGTLLTLTPVVYGSATVTVTAWDPAGLSATQSLRVGVSDRPQRAILGNMLAATARGHLASVRAALGRRMEAGACEASRLSVMGRSVPLGRTEAAAMLGRIGTGARSAAAAALGLGDGAGRPGGAMRPPAGPGALTAGPVPEREDRMEAALRSVPARALGIGAGTGAGAADFLLGWGGSEEDGERCPVRGRWSLWGQGDVQRFEGTPSVYGYDADYDGELSTAYVGLDTRMGKRWLAGVALSRSKGGGDWRAGTSEGRLTQFMTAVHPYLRWEDGSTSVWASVGAGRGDARNVRAAGRLGTSPTNLRLGLVELERRLGAPGGLDFSIMADAAWARLRTGEGGETIDGQDIAVNQVRIGADLSLPARLGDAELTPFGTVHARRDGGAGQTGDGIEVAGGLRAVRGIVRLDAQARMLTHHSAEGYGERGAAVTLALGKQESEEGFSLSVSPRWGGPARASGALLHGPLGGGFPSGGSDPDRWTLDARAGYGFSLPGGLKLDIQGGYGGALGSPSFGLYIGRPAAPTPPE